MVQEQAAQLAQLQIARYEAARVAPLREGHERTLGAEDHQRDLQRKGTISRPGGGPGPGGGGDDDPNGDEDSISGYSEDREEVSHTEVTAVAGAHQMTRTRGGETDPIRGSEGDAAPEAIQGHWAPRDLGDPPDLPDGKGIRDRSQGAET